MTWVMPSRHVLYWLLFPKYEFINDDYYVYPYEWYSHDGSDCAYEVDNPALYADVLHRISVSTGLIIILLKPDIVGWRNGRPSDAGEETVLTEDCYGVYEEQADVKYAAKEKHE